MFMCMITFNFHLSQEHHGRLMKAAHEQERSGAEIVRRAVARVLEEHEFGQTADASGFVPGGAAQGGSITAPAAAAPTGEEAA
jgi:predicted transcriptional regulator